MFFQPEIKYVPLCIGARNGELFCHSVTEFFLNPVLIIFTYFNEAHKCFWVWNQDCVITQDCKVQIIKQTLQISGVWKWTAVKNGAKVNYCRCHLTSF